MINSAELFDKKIGKKEMTKDNQLIMVMNEYLKMN